MSKSVIPLPLLSMPEIKELQQTDFVTTIIIHYKDDALAKIQEQAAKITPETILFLRNIETIKFVGFDGIEDVTGTKKKLSTGKSVFQPTQKINFRKCSWLVFEEEAELPEEYSDQDEQEYYQIKIAVADNFKMTSPYLYAFFPTNIQLKQPYVLHATFDLDPTRNQINNSNKNDFILEKVVRFTIQVAKYFTENTVSYRPLEILFHEHKADTLEELGYYELINQAIEEEEIFPCIDNTYKKAADTIFINDDFAQMIIKIAATDHLGYHLLSLETTKLDDQFIEGIVDRSLSALSKPENVINDLASLNLNYKNRALLIAEIVKNCHFIKDSSPNKLNLLLNVNQKIIPGSEYIYTPITQKDNLKTPSFANIQFVDQQLFAHLLISLKYNPKNNLNRGRYVTIFLHACKSII